MSGGFTHLHTHSHYSVLDGLGKVDDIVKKAKDIGSVAVAITDHASLSCLPELMKYSAEHNIKPIPGAEFYIVSDAVGIKGEKRVHLSVWAKSWEGVQSILKQLSVANKQFYRRPRLTWEQALEFEDCIIGTACAGGVLSIVDYEDKVLALRRVYGDDLYLEIMPHIMIEDGIDYQRKCNDRALDLYNKYGIGLIATNDAHYVNKEDAHTHDVLLAIQTGKSLSDPERWSFGGEEFYLKTRQQMHDSLHGLGYIGTSDILSSLENTVILSNKINIEMPKFGVHLPTIYPNEDEVFQQKIIAGYKTLIDGVVEHSLITEYLTRLSYEIQVIKKLGFVKYFLMVDDIITWSRAQDIMVGPGRGSAAGSLVCYLMGITQVDPIKFGLYFERFLNPERIDLPDIDVDFQDDRRDEVFSYIRTKYGHDRTSRINTFGFLAAKSAFRDVCRAYDINILTVNMLSRQIEDDDSFEKVPEIAKFAKENPEVIEQTKKLIGVIRQVGQHACGVCVSSEPLSGLCAIERRGESEVINWDKDDAEKFGLVKMDILGLSTLTILNKAQKLIEERHGIKIDFTKIPLDDEKTLDAFCRGDGIGVFQFENGGMQQLLKDLKCGSFEIATATTALFRPGSLNSGQTGQYVRISRGDEYEKYECEKLKGILGETKGILVYQEQIMQIFSQLGGMSWAQADKMRKIIGKKLGKDEFEKHREGFVNGCVNVTKSCDEMVASSLFDKMAEFAAYSFNKSHAVAYTMLSFWSMYIKVHYPVDFFAAQLNSSSDDRIGVLSREAEKNGITIARPDINISGYDFSIDDCDRIIPPIGIVKGVGEKAVETILEARKKGVFISRKDMVERVERRSCNSRVQDFLFRAGAFESLGEKVENEEERVRNFSELLPTFNKLPRLMKHGANIDGDKLKEVLRNGMMCSCSQSRKFLMPKFVGSELPSIMVINNAVKGESELLTSDGTQFLIKELKNRGIRSKDIYYTSPIKCFFDKGKSPNKECEGKCTTMLREEIAAIRPKIIVVFTATAVPLFSKEKPQMGKLNNTLIYSKEFGCYVLFSYSPQYAFFADEKQDQFFESMDTLGSIFAS